jgi:hypothetical protein
VTLLLGRSAPGAEMDRGEETDRKSPPPKVDPRMHSALTDLHAYVLALDAEREGLGDGGHLLGGPGCREDAEKALLRLELAEELCAVRTVLSARRATSCSDRAANPGCVPPPGQTRSPRTARTAA